MSLYEKVLASQKYLETVQKIEETSHITNGKWNWDHGLNHDKRVACYVQKILVQLNADTRTIDLGMTAALLHDIGLCKGKRNDHAKESSLLFDKFLNEDDLSDQEKSLLKQAIADHSNGDSIQSLIGAALILADKLDITCHRIENSGIQNEINQEIQKIKEVNIQITDDFLRIQYKTEPDFQEKILRIWPKAIIIPQKVAHFLQKRYVFLINEREIDCDSLL